MSATATSLPSAAELAAQVLRDRFNQRACVWSGPTAVALVALGLVVISGFIPPQSPSAGASTIARYYADGAGQIRAGMVVAAFGFTLLLPFGIALALQTSRIERRPVASWIQIACVAFAVVAAVMSVMVWEIAAYRPTDTDPDITRMLNDAGWFVFLWTIMPFSLWIGVIGYTVLCDQRPDPVFPRWIGYFNCWVALSILPGAAIGFFKSGPLGFDGILALYLPAGIFFIWMVVMTLPLLRAVDREAATRRPRHQQGD